MWVRWGRGTLSPRPLEAPPICLYKIWAGWGRSYERPRPLEDPSIAMCRVGGRGGACSDHAPFVRLHQSPRVYMGLLGAGLWLRPRPLRVGRGRLLPLWGHWERQRDGGALLGPEQPPLPENPPNFTRIAPKRALNALGCLPAPQPITTRVPSVSHLADQSPRGF